MYVFDRSLHPSSPGVEFAPDLCLTGHTAEGFGLEWHPIMEGLLASGSEDTVVGPRM